MKNNYDNIANLYDFLSRLFFLKTQVKAQVEILKYIKANSTILIVGGGSGWILEELAKLHHEGLVIDYVEISEKMLNRSKKRDYKKNNVFFFRTAIEDFRSINSFDVIITAFLFDNFLEEKADKVFNLLNKQLRSAGNWLYTDFYVDPRKDSSWKRWLLAIMYKFFRYICDVEADKLVNMEKYFKNSGYTEIKHSSHYLGFIKGIVYRKNR
ncbi:class I SAM-dependent methyltransferase [Olivibacter domesticus]|uniref:Methyltransferase domain-containing protein n=1 Tax=Olivibacter domesticus TaxID=407022 RepID=A0A1H7I3S9_OLID1|nr:class I SAM-dependent methyltransferase [Olivibacter domesticus]SEK56100.1 Methyltransferase domain-containing protein [Olivibacter domesticus]